MTLEEFVAVSSGELIDTQISDDGKKVYFYEIQHPVQACELALVVGDFRVLADPRTPATVRIRSNHFLALPCLLFQRFTDVSWANAH